MSVHGVGIEREEQLDTGFEQRVIPKLRVGGKELLGGGDKIILTGAPVRGEILAADRAKAREKFGLTDDDQLRIYKTYHRKKGQDIFGPTKNSKKGGNRNVPIPHWLAEEFRTYCSRLYGLTPDDRVFYMTCTALNKELTRCTQLTYLPDIRVHDLRHSHVSLCIELGYSVVLVARRIGDTVPVVMRTYAHLYPNKQQELVSKLEAIGSPSSNDDEPDLMSLG